MEITERAMRNLALKICHDRTLNATEHRILIYFIGILPPNLRLEISHREIAQRLGMSRPQTSRAMRRLENKYYFTKLANKVYRFPDRLKTECPTLSQGTVTMPENHNPVPGPR